MALIVQKFGGTSMGSIERIKNAAHRSLATARERDATGDPNRVVVIVSAMSGETDRLMLAQSRRAMLNQARAATDARRERAQAAVALFKALGGGWRDPPVD